MQDSGGAEAAGAADLRRPVSGGFFAIRTAQGNRPCGEEMLSCLVLRTGTVVYVAT